MKTVASLLAGTALAVSTLLGGVVLASAVLEPRDETPHFTGLDVADLWTLTPVRVDPENQTYERLPPRYGSNVVMASASATPQQPDEEKVASVVQKVDVIETSAVTELDQGSEAPVLSPAHVSWCEARYRSYSADDNSYISYRGEMRSCVSPYLNGSPEETGDAKATLVQDETGNATPVAVNSLHANNCLQRYRSYRAEDNSYQPYGGGPRKQCELRTF
ncbi:BA14K family protein [Rhizobium glycinendophyticum]|nr:BA14K family protein [Rhizobium glycinendophyticum]